jgi:hypothetical protein
LDYLGGIVGKTNSEIILFFVLVIIGLVVAGIPLIKVLARNRAEKLNHELEAELRRSERDAARLSNILAVISSNTEALQRIGSLAENAHFASEKGFERLNNKLENVFANTERINAALKNAF